jgi:hypothetical protein
MSDATQRDKLYAAFAERKKKKGGQPKNTFQAKMQTDMDYRAKATKPATTAPRSTGSKPKHPGVLSYPKSGEMKSAAERRKETRIKKLTVGFGKDKKGKPIGQTTIVDVGHNPSKAKQAKGKRMALNIRPGKGTRPLAKAPKGPTVASVMKSNMPKAPTYKPINVAANIKKHQRLSPHLPGETKTTPFYGWKRSENPHLKAPKQDAGSFSTKSIAAALAVTGVAAGAGVLAARKARLAPKRNKGAAVTAARARKPLTSTQRGVLEVARVRSGAGRVEGELAKTGELKRPPTKIRTWADKGQRGTTVDVSPGRRKPIGKVTPTKIVEVDHRAPKMKPVETVVTARPAKVGRVQRIKEAFSDPAVVAEKRAAQARRAPAPEAEPAPAKPRGRVSRVARGAVHVGTAPARGVLHAAQKAAKAAGAGVERATDPVAAAEKKAARAAVKPPTAEVSLERWDSDTRKTSLNTAREARKSGNVEGMTASLAEGGLPPDGKASAKERTRTEVALKKAKLTTPKAPKAPKAPAAPATQPAEVEMDIDTRQKVSANAKAILKAGNVEGARAASDALPKTGRRADVLRGELEYLIETGERPTRYGKAKVLDQARESVAAVDEVKLDQAIEKMEVDAKPENRVGPRRGKSGRRDQPTRAKATEGATAPQRSTRRARGTDPRGTGETVIRTPVDEPRPADRAPRATQPVSPPAEAGDLPTQADDQKAARDRAQLKKDLAAEKAKQAKLVARQPTDQPPVDAEKAEALEKKELAKQLAQEKKQVDAPPKDTKRGLSPDDLKSHAEALEAARIKKDLAEEKAKNAQLRNQAPETGADKPTRQTRGSTINKSKRRRANRRYWTEFNEKVETAKEAKFEIPGRTYVAPRAGIGTGATTPGQTISPGTEAQEEAAKREVEAKKERTAAAKKAGVEVGAGQATTGYHQRGASNVNVRELAEGQGIRTPESDLAQRAGLTDAELTDLTVKMDAVSSGQDPEVQAQKREDAEAKAEKIQKEIDAEHRKKVKVLEAQATKEAKTAAESRGHSEAAQRGILPSNEGVGWYTNEELGEIDDRRNTEERRLQERRDYTSRLSKGEAVVVLEGEEREAAAKKSPSRRGRENRRGKIVTSEIRPPLAPVAESDLEMREEWKPASFERRGESFSAGLDAQDVEEIKARAELGSKDAQNLLNRMEREKRGEAKARREGEANAPNVDRDRLTRERELEYLVEDKPKEPLPVRAQPGAKLQAEGAVAPWQSARAEYEEGKDKGAVTIPDVERRGHKVTVEGGERFVDPKPAAPRTPSRRQTPEERRAPDQPSPRQGSVTYQQVKPEYTPEVPVRHPRGRNFGRAIGDLATEANRRFKQARALAGRVAQVIKGPGIELAAEAGKAQGRQVVGKKGSGLARGAGRFGAPVAALAGIFGVAEGAKAASETQGTQREKIRAAQETALEVGMDTAAGVTEFSVATWAARRASLAAAGAGTPFLVAAEKVMPIPAMAFTAFKVGEVVAKTKHQWDSQVQKEISEKAVMEAKYGTVERATQTRRNRNRKLSLEDAGVMLDRQKAEAKTKRDKRIKDAKKMGRRPRGV